MKVPFKKGPSDKELKELQSWRQEQKNYLSLLPLSVLSKVPSWKESYQDVFSVFINDNWFVYRGLTLDEFTNYMSQSRFDIFGECLLDSLKTLSMYQLSMGVLFSYINPNPYICASNDILMKKVVLYPEDTSNIDVSTALCLVGCIINSSGFNSNQIRKYMADNGNIMSTNYGLLAVISSMLKIDVDELRNKTASQIALYASCTEGITGKPIFKDNIDINSHKTMGDQKPSDFADLISKHKADQIKDSAPNGIINIKRENMELQQMGFSEESGINTALTILQEIKDQLRDKR